MSSDLVTSESIVDQNLSSNSIKRKSQQDRKTSSHQDGKLNQHFTKTGNQTMSHWDDKITKRKKHTKENHNLCENYLFI
jgi:uncharacterized protein YdaU (DUF1376 family)